MQSSPQKSVLRQFVEAAMLFGLSAITGLILLIILFKVGLFSGIDIVFYRGIVICVLVAAVIMVVVWLVARQPLRDGIAAAVLTLGLNMSFLVIAPVTVDRSISVFMLGYMAAHEQGPVSAQEMAQIFEQKYVIEMRQIERRMAEQIVSGNLREVGDGYVLSEQGQRFIRIAKWIAWAFDTDMRFVSPSKLGEN